MFRVRIRTPGNRTLLLRGVPAMPSVLIRLAAFRKRFFEKVRENDGFTLIEMLVVLTIIGLIMGLTGPQVMKYFEDSKHKSAKIQVEAISGALELFYLDNARYPTETEGLKALVTRPASLSAWNGPYLKNGVVPVDPWGKAYVYTAIKKGRSYSVGFVAPDGADTTLSPKSATATKR
jgi:general secretion pathway protein G